MGTVLVLTFLAGLGGRRPRPGRLKRRNRPLSVQAILWFASDASRSVTGQILYVDHGTSLYG